MEIARLAPGRSSHLAKPETVPFVSPPPLQSLTQEKIDDTRASSSRSAAIRHNIPFPIISVLVVLGGLIVVLFMYVRMDPSSQQLKSQPLQRAAVTTMPPTVAGNQTIATLAAALPTKAAALPIDLSQVRPQHVSPGTPLQSQGWQYDFADPLFVKPLEGPIGNVAPQGRFVHVLVTVINQTGTPQPIPADFFVLKDDQNDVSYSLLKQSTDYLERGVNGDLSQEDQVPIDNKSYNMILIFDIARGATNLVFFAASKPDQGWLVLERV